MRHPENPEASMAEVAYQTTATGIAMKNMMTAERCKWRPSAFLSSFPAKNSPYDCEHNVSNAEALFMYQRQYANSRISLMDITALTH
jgi:hypothetical protein